MKSRISLFDRGVSRSLLRRFWPLWASYLVILVLSTLTQVRNMLFSAAQTAPSELLVPVETVLTSALLQNAAGLLILSGIAAPILAGAMFGHLYNKRMCGLMNSLPLRRETMFFTAWLTGLLPLLASNLLIALLSLGIHINSLRLPLTGLLQWMAIMTMGNLCFYNFAVFCAMLTGRKIFLPLLYVFLNFAAVLLWACAGSLTEALVYGFAQGELPAWVEFLTPAVNLSDKLLVTPLLNMVNSADSSVQRFLQTYSKSVNWGLLGVYTGLSFLFLLLGLLLYRRRQMEKAGDTVAVRWAVPVLKVLFCALFTVGFALLLAELILGSSSHLTVGGSWATFLAFLLIGLFLGYFLSEMMLRRTVRVFRGAWRGFFIGAALLLAFALCCRFDVFGYERYVPEPDEIASVTIDGAYKGHLEQPENLEALTALHRESIALRDGKLPGQTLRSLRLTFRYELKNGRTASRSYFLTSQAILDKTYRLCCEPESIYYRMSWMQGRIRSIELLVFEENRSSSRIDLNAADIEDLMKNGILPDAREGNIARPEYVAPVGSTVPESAGAARSYFLHVSLTEKDDWGSSYYYDLNLSVRSVNTLRWIEDYLARTGAVAAKELSR